MPGICRDTTDSAGGALIKSQTTVLANGKEVIVHGDSITSHGDSPHDSPTMIASHTSSDNVFIGGVAVCNAGDLATCSHKASGSGNVNVNSPGPSVSSDISVAAAIRVSSSQTSTDNDVRDIKFNNDGTKVFVLGRDNDNVYEYSVSTPFDVSTMSAVVQTLDISVVSSTQGDNAANGIDFNTDGTKLFVLGQGQDNVDEYALSTGFDLSTASFTRSLDISGQENQPYGIAFNNDGTKMFITGRRGDDVNEYVLTTGFDISSASYSQRFAITQGNGRPSAVQFNSDGTKMYILEGGTTNLHDNTIFQYTLTTAFDVSTASVASDKIDFDGTDSSRSNEGDSIILDGIDSSSSDAGSYLVTEGTSFSVVDEENKARGFCFGDNGTQLYVAGWRGDDINQYAAADTIVGT